MQVPHVLQSDLLLLHFNSFLYEMSMRGRPRKYATDSAKKRAQAEQKRNRPPAKVYIGEEFMDSDRRNDRHQN